MFFSLKVLSQSGGYFTDPLPPSNILFFRLIEVDEKVKLILKRRHIKASRFAIIFTLQTCPT